MPSQEAVSELATLERLRTDEEALDRHLEEARRDAERYVADARETARRERALQSAQLQEELKARAAQLEGRRAAVVAAASDDAKRRIAEIARGAQARFDEALAFVLDAVEGGSQ